MVFFSTFDMGETSKDIITNLFKIRGKEQLSKMYLEKL